MAQKSSNAGLSAMLTSALIQFTKFSLLPCTLLYLYEMKGNSWSYTVALYGLLLSSLAVGQLVGQSLRSRCSADSPIIIFSYVLLPISFVLLCFVTRFVLMMLLFAGIGMFGTLLSEIFFVIDRNTPKLFYVHSQTDAEQRSQNERVIICFVFATLLSGALYDFSVGAQFPLSRFATLTMTVSSVIILYYAWIIRIATHKRSAAAPGIGYSSGGSIGGGGGLDMSSGGGGGAGRTLTPLEQYTGPVPMPFMNVAAGDLTKARQLYSAMLQWRRDNNVDTVLETYQPGFEEIAKYYPNKMHGYTKEGYAVVYEQLGQADAKKLLSAGVTVEMMCRNQILRNEHIFRRMLDPNVVMYSEDSPYEQQQQQQQQPKSSLAKQKLHSPCSPEDCRNGSGKIFSVLDVGGISMSSVTTDVISYLKQTSFVMDSYFPDRVERLVIVNSPRWFFTIWNVIARALPESVQKKVDILNSVSALDKYISPDQRPTEYGGTDGSIGTSEGHLAFMELPKAWKKHHHSDLHRAPGFSATSSAVESLASEANVSDRDSKHQHSAAGKNTEKKKNGLFQWLSGDDKKVPPQAQLGYKNSYKYNKASRMWELDPDLLDDEDEDEEDEVKDSSADGTGGGVRNRSGGGGTGVRSNEAEKAATYASNSSSSSVNSPMCAGGAGRKPLTPAQIEENNVVLAIQAAHLASSYNKQEKAARAAAAAASSSTAFKLHSSFDSLEDDECSSFPLGSSDAGNSGGKTAHQLELLRKRQMQMMSGAPILSGSHRSAASEMGRDSGPSGVETSSDAGSDTCTSVVPKALRNGLEGTGGSPKLSSPLFLVVVSMYLTTHMVQCGLFTLLPVWMATPRVDGGLGYGIVDMGMVMSGAALVVLQVHSCFGLRLQSTVKASPVRILRATLVTLLVILVLIQFTLRIGAPLEDMQGLLVAGKHGTHEASHLRGISAAANEPSGGGLGKSSTEMRMFEEAASFWFTESSAQSLHPLLPSQSFSQLFLPSFLLGTMFCCVAICTRASSLLLHLALKTSFSSPSTVRWTLSAMLDILGPAVATLAYAGVYKHSLTAAYKHLKSSAHHQLDTATSVVTARVTSNMMGALTPRARYEYVISHPHGSNSTFFISLCAAGVVLVYMLSIFLRIQFRGDYGVISDSEGANSNNVQEANVALSATAFDSEHESSGSTTYSGRQYHQLFIANNKRNMSNSRSSPAGSSSCCNQDVFSVPTADISSLWPLLWQGAALMPVYGSKLYNLRDDFKDL